MASNQPGPRDFFLKFVLYKRFPVGLADEVLNFEDILDFYCPQCDDISTFRRDGAGPRTTRARAYAAAPILLTAKSPLTSNSVDPKNIQPIYEEIKFICGRNEKHIAFFIFRIDGESISKIGEDPSLADRLFPAIRKYRAELGEKFFKEFRTAINLYSHGLGIGAFVYLRRVLEKVIRDVAIEKYSDVENWSFENWRKDKKVNDIIDDLKEKLPSFLIENRIIYGILSKGIHELEEEDCLNYFETVQEAISEILDDIINNRQKAIRREKIHNTLSHININLETKKSD